MMIRISHPKASVHRQIVIEETDSVAYAYLLEDEVIVSDVWLYNIGEAPEKIDTKRTRPPYQNPSRYCSKETVQQITASSKIHCDWEDESVSIFVDDQLLAVLMNGQKPGFSRYSLQANSLAKPLSEHAL